MARVDLIIKAIDQASNVIGSIDRRLQGLQNTTKGFVGDTILGGLAIGAGFAAVNTAINIATSAIGSFASALSNAADIQVESTVLAGQLSQLLNKSYEETNSILDQLNKNITEQVDVLPGLTEGYTRLGRQLLDSVIPAATELGGSLNTRKLIEYTTELSRAYGLLAQTTPGLTTGEVLTTLTKAISGTSTIAELSRLDLFQKNPILLRGLREELIRRGVDELKDLDEAARVEVLRKVGNLILDDETVSRLSNTLQGRLEGFVTKLFDPTSGIFGFARQIETRGSQTVLSAVNNAVGQFFEVLNEISDIFADLGFRDTGALELIYDFFTWIAQQLNSLELLIKANRGKILQSLEFVRKFISGNSSFGEFIYKLGESIGRLIGLNIDDILKGGQVFNDLAGKIISAIQVFIAGLISGIGQGLLLEAENQARIISGNITGSTTEVLIEYFTDLILNNLGVSLQGLASKQGDDLARFVSDNFIGIMKSYFNSLIPFWGDSLNAQIPSIIDVLVSGVTGIFNLLVNGVERIFNSVKNAIPVVGDIIPDVDVNNTRPENTGKNIKNSAYGHIPLMNAISIESRLAPGTKPIIANDSEFVLTQNQMKNLLTNTQGNVPNITINIQGILDERIVRQMKDAINSEWKHYKNSSYRTAY